MDGGDGPEGGVPLREVAPLPPWDPPALEDCDPFFGVTPLPLAAPAYVYRILSRLHYAPESGQLVRFCIILQHLYQGEWLPIAEVDDVRGSVRVHRYDRSGARVSTSDEVMRISEPGDVHNGCRFGYAELLSNWEEYRRRWDR
jgi:hypothetical protein